MNNLQWSLLAWQWEGTCLTPASPSPSLIIAMTWDDEHFEYSHTFLIVAVTVTSALHYNQAMKVRKPAILSRFWCFCGLWHWNCLSMLSSISYIMWLFRALRAKRQGWEMNLDESAALIHRNKESQRSNFSWDVKLNRQSRGQRLARPYLLSRSC